MKNSKFILGLLTLSVLLFSCEKDDGTTGSSKSVTKENNGVYLQEINKKPLVQYTPNSSPWNTFENGPLQDYAAYKGKNGYEYRAHKAYNSNALKDITFMTAEDWKNNYWDGTPFNPEKLTRVELHKAMFPNHKIMRGLKQLYDKHKPFKDEKKPTKAEVDEWNRLVVNHFRALCGYGAEKYKVNNKHGLYIMSLWSDEAKFTKKWDNEDYRGGRTVGVDKKILVEKPNGQKKPLGENGHYGFGFLPSESKRAVYYPSSGGTPTFYKGAGGAAEGVSSVRQWEPWSIKLSVVLSNFLEREGFWGGHLGPFWHREKIGFSYYKPFNVPDAKKRIDVQVRVLSHGELRKPLYIDPDGPQKGKPDGPGGKY